MLAVANPDNDCAQERTDHLRGDVRRHVGPGKQTDRRQPHRHRRVDVAAADATHAVDGNGDREAPPCGDHEPTRPTAFGAGQDDIGDDPVSQQHENAGAGQLGDERFDHTGLCAEESIGWNDYSPGNNS